MRFFLFLLVLAYNCQAQTLTFNLAFQRADKIFVFDEKANKAVSVIQGNDACLSPDGSKIAYTSNTTGTRKVVAYSLDTKKHLTINVGNHTSYAPVWSPDGNYLAFQTFVDGVWYTGLFSFVDQSFRLLTRAHESYAPSWAADSKRILVQDMNKLYIYERNGQLVKNYNLGPITKDYSTSSDSKFILTPDEQFLLFTADAFDAAGMPVGAVFMYNLKTSALTRLSPKGMSCTGDLFLNNQNELFFCGSYDHEKEENIHKLDLITKKMTTVIRNGRNPSARLTSNETIAAATDTENNNKYPSYVGTYEYINNFPFNKKGIKENHYIVLWKEDGRITGLYFGPSTDFEEATEEVPEGHPHIPGFFVTNMRDLVIDDNKISFGLTVSEADLFTKPISLKITSTDEAKSAGYKHWNFQIESHTNKYTGQFKLGQTLVLWDEIKGAERAFRKMEY
ncbi:TolB family protein [Flavisolibacter tropicus]|uniref:Dipeptidylpeptidase IV N-terminal domain-containing protein n=1 Tax=Flavisolibacter tropicus TaxID=1492898 RepID=A0A172TZ01_9BACT|nr:PD40 domain-containing protein [Flavisolibacter tropicus]ANE52331.1 hypothetical protein SY85_19405 [Flavisolibacter tropicus]